MTYEATKEQFLISLNSNAYINMCTSDDMKNAIEALEKQTPKKPGKLTDIFLIREGWTYECPTCRCACGVNKNHPDVTSDEFYCTQCGQKLDWE